jgi:hypothetical protein
MKRKYDEIDAPPNLKRKRQIQQEPIRIYKKPKKDPMIRLFALVKGYLARKLHTYRMYPFYN